jgi:endonuclease-3 related protein
MRNLPPDVALYNDYHAQLVMVGKDFCKPSPRCESCPLRRFARGKTGPARKSIG